MNIHLKRRGFDHGSYDLNKAIQTIDTLANWQQGKPILLRSACEKNLLLHQQHIDESAILYQAILNNEEAEFLLDQIPYIDRIQKHFESLGSSINEGDDQEIETVLFDAICDNTNSEIDNELIAEDLWMKISWLSFYEEDASLRFRFSFGVDLHEDVALDKNRQHYASLLTDAIFPESAIITQNGQLIELIKQTLNCDSVDFVERIIYFNAPDGGAYLHHDRERGHAGVVYAQLTGSTYWIALTKKQLIKELITFIQQSEIDDGWPSNISGQMQTELLELAKNIGNLSDELESFSHSTLIHLINETEAFTHQLILNDHCRVVQAGDILLLPQETEDNCCWHSVFTLGDNAGQSLSFAIKKSG